MVFNKTMEYEDKIRHAIKLLQSIPTDGGPIEVSYSGGKDSDVILELAKMAGIPFEAVYKQTTLDPPGTTKHVKEMGATIVRPEMTFLQLVEKWGWPTRRARFCCRVLKEYKVHDRAIQGIRRCESKRRGKRYKEPEVCRVYRKKDKVRVYLPILEWTDEDVERFIKERGIKCAPVYYEKDGTFDVRQRLGCIGCPMKDWPDMRKDFKKYPKLLRALVKASDRYLDTHPNAPSSKKFGNCWNMAYHNLFCKTYDDYLSATTGGLFPENALDTKSYLEDYFGIDLSI